MTDDDRVRCWDCKHWAPADIYLRVRQIHGKMESERVRGRTCRHKLGHDPLILRRCDEHARKRPEHIVPIPPGYRPGWG